MKLVSLTAFSSMLCASALFVACGPGNGAADGGDGDIGDGLNSSGGSDGGGIDGVGAMNGEGAGTGTGTGGGTDEPMEDCDSTLELILRDFNADHPDMEAFGGGQDGTGCGIVMPDLQVGSDGSRQPVFQAGSGTGIRSIAADNTIVCTPHDEFYTPPAEVTDADTFSEWYANVDGTNIMIEHTLPLTENPDTGTYVYDSAGTAGFFPLDGLGFAEETQGHNFHFTTEAHVKFGYQAGQKFTFSGDDDLWIFVNGKIALDLGGLHGPITATIDFDAQAADLGIKPGMTYNMDIYHAERHTSASNFRVETNISCFETVVVPVIVK